MIILQSDTN